MRTKPSTEKNISPRIVCTAPWRLTKVQPLDNYKLEVEFIDGVSGQVEMFNLIMSNKSGIFAALKNLNLFHQVYLEYGVATWPGDIDLAPDTLHAAIKHYGKYIFN